MSNPTDRTLDRDLQWMTWGLAILIAVVVMFLLSGMGSLSGRSIAGLLTGITAPPPPCSPCCATPMSGVEQHGEQGGGGAWDQPQQ